MASITNLGSVSGLPLEKILTDLAAANDKALQRYDTRATSYQARINAYSQLQSALEAVQKSAATLGKPETMAAMTGSVTGGNALTATVGEGAAAGQYSIEVKNLAIAQGLRSGAVADRTAKNGDTGTFEIELTNGTKRTIDLKGDTSLNGIVKAINADDKAGVRATVLNDGNGNNYLMLTAKDTGVQASVKNITVTGDQSLKNILGFSTAADGTTSGMTQTKAKDAELVINGLTVKSGSNNVSKVIDGVTLNLTDTTPTDKPIQLKLEADVSVATKAVQDFVKTYNALQTTIKGLTAYNPKEPDDTKKASPLTGDGTTRSIQSAVSSVLSGALGSGNVKSLADLGITTDPDAPAQAGQRQAGQGAQGKPSRRGHTAQRQRRPGQEVRRRRQGRARQQRLAQEPHRRPEQDHHRPRQSKGPRQSRQRRRTVGHAYSLHRAGQDGRPDELHRRLPEPTVRGDEQIK